MNAADWMIVVFVGLWAVVAVIYLVRSRKKGGCSCSGCAGCSGECSACKKNCKECHSEESSK